MQNIIRFTPRRAYGLVAVLSLLLTAFVASAAGKGAVFNESGVAIRGYDPVAYFTEQTALAGKSTITHQWRGATWQFASAANRDRFVADPERYTPQYGGYCAYAASNGYIAPTDPHAWTVHDGKLYLNYSKHVRSRWLEDVPGHISRADVNWPDLMKKL